MGEEIHLPMQITVNLENNGYAVLTGANIQYWADNGPTTFFGSLNDFNVQYPTVMAELLERGLVKKVD